MGIAVRACASAALMLLAAWATLGMEALVRRGGPGALTASATAQPPALPNRDRWLYPAGPFVALAGVLLAALVIPLGPHAIADDLGIGVFYFIVVLDFVVLGVALSGWGSNASDPVEAFYRVVAQLVAYVVPLGMALVGAIMMAKSMSTSRIVAAQSSLWFIVLQPVGFVLYVVSALMQCYRPPFAEPFSPEIGGGILSVTGGWAALVWRLALAGLLFLVAALGAVTFLGGWLGPWLPPPVWMLLKTFALMALMLLVGERLRPVSTARMLAFSWKILIPVGLVNVLIVGTLILLHIGPA